SVSVGVGGVGAAGAAEAASAKHFPGVPSTRLAASPISVMNFFMGLNSLGVVGWVRQMAASPFSSVRMRMACSSFETNTLPSPILPVLAVLTMAATVASALASETTTSILIL